MSKERKNFFFDFLNDINFQKKGIYNEETKDDYKPWSINKFLSGNIDTVLYAQDMNKLYHLDHELQYDYYLHSIKKKKRFSKWVKNKKEEMVELLMKYYNYNREKAKQVINLHSKEDLKMIKHRMFVGGS